MARRTLTFLILLSALAGILAACSGNGDPNAEAIGDGPMPVWIDEVTPAPGASASGAAAVEVDHQVVADGEAVRLKIDGTDVTSYARSTATGLRYESGDGPVALDPGRHTATVEHTTFRDGTDAEVLESWSWTFQIL